MSEKELFGNSEQLNDTISRAAALDAPVKMVSDGFDWIPLYHIKALPSAQPSATDTNVATTDTISRAAVLDEIHKYMEERDYTIGTLYDNICEMPSAQQERKKGKWIYNSPVTMKCNQCGFVIKDWDWHRFKYCPNCIADMRGENDG